MKIVKIPNTDIYTSRLGFGTSSLHHLYFKSQRRRLIFSALDSGFRYFDTARMYGDGLCERSLGENIPSSLRSEITLSTKFGIQANPIFEKLPLLMYSSKISKKILKNKIINVKRDISLHSIRSSLNKSLDSLNTDWIDIFFLHEPTVEDIPTLKKSIEWLIEQKKNGKIRYLGLAGNAMQCIQVNEYFSNIFDILQVEDSIEKKESNALILNDMPIQITFGYIRQSALLTNNFNPMESLRKGLIQNKNGVVIVSSRNPHRISKMAKLT